MQNLFLALVMFMIPTSLLALPLGNPGEASLHTNGVFWDKNVWCDCEPSPSFFDAFNIRLGYYGDFVFDRHLKVDRKNNRSQIHKTEINTNAVYLALGICNSFDLFGTIGASKIDISTPSSALGFQPIGLLNNPFVDIDTETTLSWSAGLRGTLLRWGCLALGLEIQYFRTKPHLNSINAPDFDTFYFVNEERPLYHEWQVGFGASYRINIADRSSALVPYAGIKWSHCRFTSDNEQTPLLITLYDLENNRDWGYACGLTLLGYNKSSITVEARYRNEKALYVNGQFRF